MEALLEREAEKVENRNDDRLDELSRCVDDGFMEMREGFAGTDARLDELFYVQILFVGSLAIALLTGKV